MAGFDVGIPKASTGSVQGIAHATGTPADALSPGSANAAPPVDSDFLARFVAFMDEVQKRLQEGKLAEAHLALSSLYDNSDVPSLPPAQMEQFNKLLGELAGTVIYSRQHFLEKPYVVQSGDTLDRVAQQYNIPWQFLGKINGLLPPDAGNDVEAKDRPLPAAMELKVVRGPFDAVINLNRHELTLYLQNRYAGRFPIGVGHDQPNLEGIYTVCDKSLNPSYYGPDGVNIGPGDPKNPLGKAWIALNDRIGIHGANSPQSIGRDDNRGSICAGEQDIQDLYGILSVGSKVKILR
jgi:hypothetical protein